MIREPFQIKDDEKKRASTQAAIARRDLVASLCILTLIITLALCRIALDANWIKCVRVSLAFVIYVGVLLVLLRTFVRVVGVAAQLSFWPFAFAAAVAELASGWLRTGAHFSSTTLEMALAAGLLIGGLHCLSLRSWRLLRNRIENISTPNVGHVT